MELLKRLAATLPLFWQDELKRIRFRRQIRKNSFLTSEPEYRILDSLIGRGDWAIDIGANVGHYTKRLSELVGPEGRVIAFEPVKETFGLLTANAELLPYPNVTLVNVAVSDRCELLGMEIPSFETGLRNYYQARLVAGETVQPNLKVLTIRIDSLGIPQKVALVKIDVEGHELGVLRGMEEILARDHPILIVETNSVEVTALLTHYGYEAEHLEGSPNWLYRQSSRENYASVSLTG